MSRLVYRYLGALIFLGVFMPLNVSAQLRETASYSPAVNATYPKNVYWGDTHVHTNLSFDANGWGKNKKLSPSDAYRFAKGGTVIAHNGMAVKLQRPLDFIVIADHAESLGVMDALEKESKALLQTDFGARLIATLNEKDPSKLWTKAGRDFYQKLKAINHSRDSTQKIDEEEIFRTSMAIDITVNRGVGEPLNFQKSVWNEIVKQADQQNRPGLFTAFIGYEWASEGSDLGNLHRVVLFADSADKVVDYLPFTFYQSSNPEDLWEYLHRYEKETSGSVMAIPHNGNLSKGEMFNPVDFTGEPLTAEGAKTRSRWEPLYEVTQIKGDSEAYPLLSPDDKFADYETWSTWKGKDATAQWNNAERERKQKEYARPALKQGLKEYARIGVNPFKFGLIGSTDTHTSLATADENNFWGKWGNNEPNNNRVLGSQLDIWKVPGWYASAAGYAAVWAEENTRESLFAAMKRKEVYASTGPRISVRFFGGWDYQSDDAFKPDLARIGYDKGVPMGGDLTTGPYNKAPLFLIRAVKDPDGANLDRVQVIKGWHDTSGELHEKIYDVALSDNRKPNWRGTVKQVGSTVDIPNASYTNTIGDPELAVVWEDPDFNPDELAFYYLRVLEIPTPRWTAYDAKFFGLKDLPDEIPMVTQERAYSSPIWYSPGES